MPPDGLQATVESAARQRALELVRLVGGADVRPHHEVLGCLQRFRVTTAKQDINNCSNTGQGSHQEKPCHLLSLSGETALGYVQNGPEGRNYWNGKEYHYDQKLEKHRSVLPAPWNKRGNLPRSSLQFPSPLIQNLDERLQFLFPHEPKPSLE